MADIEKVNNYTNIDSNILEVQTTLDKVFIGGTYVSLTSMTDTNIPVIAAGSKFECGGTLYAVNVNTTPSGTPTDNATNYIRAVPNGATCTLEFTATAPTWSDSKQGWYGTSAQAGYVYLPIRFYRAGAVYYDKHYFVNHNTGDVSRIISGKLSYYNSNTVTIDSATAATLTGIDTKLIDTGGYFQSNVIQTGCGGKVNIQLDHNMDTGFGSTEVNIFIYHYNKSNAEQSNLRLRYQSAVAANDLTVFSTYCIAGDYIAIKQLRSGSNSTIAANKLKLSADII